MSCNERVSTSLKRSSRRNGCLNCRRRRKKCDEVKPVCGKCAAHGEVCEADDGIIFRTTGLSSAHPSMVQSRSLRTSSDHQVSLTRRFRVTTGYRQLYRLYRSIWTKALVLHITSDAEHWRMLRTMRSVRTSSQENIVVPRATSTIRSTLLSTSRLRGTHQARTPSPRTA